MSQRVVLLVEDNEELRHLYKETFRHHNFTVLEAADGQTAVNEAATKLPQVIILDLMLPRQGGLATLRVLRTLPETKHIPVIVLTALPNPEYKDMALKMVQGYYLKTEIKPMELVEKVGGLLAV